MWQLKIIFVCGSFPGPSGPRFGNFLSLGETCLERKDRILNYLLKRRLKIGNLYFDKSGDEESVGPGQSSRSSEGDMYNDIHGLYTSAAPVDIFGVQWQTFFLPGWFSRNLWESEGKTRWNGSGESLSVTHPTSPFIFFPSEKGTEGRLMFHYIFLSSMGGCRDDFTSGVPRGGCDRRVRPKHGPS